MMEEKRDPLDELITEGAVDSTTTPPAEEEPQQEARAPAQYVEEPEWHSPGTHYHRWSHL